MTDYADYDNSPEACARRLEEWKKIEWSLVHLRGYLIDSDEQIDTYVRMSGDIDFVVPFYFEQNGWDKQRSYKVSELSVGVMH